VERVIDKDPAGSRKNLTHLNLVVDFNSETFLSAATYFGVLNITVTVQT